MPSTATIWIRSFADRVKDYNGGPRTLAQTLEGIDLCIAARKSLTPELTAFLNHY